MTGNFGGLKTLAVPMDSIQGNKLHPSSFRQFDPKDPFKKTRLLESNLWTVSSCKRRRSERYVKLVMINKNLRTDRHIPDRGIMPQVLSTGMNSWSSGWHIQSSPSRKKHRLFQFLLELGVSQTGLGDGFLGRKLYIPLDWKISDGR